MGGRRANQHDLGGERNEATGRWKCVEQRKERFNSFKNERLLMKDNEFREAPASQVGFGWSKTSRC